jgi:hypothetical protein
MLLRDFGALPCYAPENEAGAEPAVEPAAPPPAGGDGGAEAEPAEPAEAEPAQPDGPGSGRSKLRKQLEGAAEKARKAPRDDKGKYQSRARQEGVAPEPGEGEEPAEEPAQQPQGQQPQVAAPEAWPKEAKAVWAQLPPAVQAAVAKRETDMAAGVEQLKQGYQELDGVLQPYTAALQRSNIKPAAAVKQLFDWMNALTREATAMKNGQPPEGVFAALARSYNIDPVRLLAHMVQNPGQQQPLQQQPGQQQPQQGQLDPAVKAYIDSIVAPVGQGVQQLYSTVQQQSMAKTSEMLDMWAKDKPFFGDVRQTMARMLQPGPNGEPAMVPPLANGNADLDKAYDMAVFADPAVRAKAFAAQAKAEQDKKTAAEATEKKAQRDKLEAARKASGSIPISAPGLPGQAKPGQQKRGKSVRETLDESIAQVRERA